MASMMSREPGIYEVRALKDWPHADAAEDYLRDIAEAVTPIMSRRGWELDLLEEFYPNEEKTLGSIKDNGRVIRLRLRGSHDRKTFHAFGLMVDAMLHELAHTVHREHDSKFQDLWDELRHEYVGDNSFRGIDRISALPDPLGARSVAGPKSVAQPSYKAASSRRAPSTVRGDSRGMEVIRPSSTSDRPTSQATAHSHRGPLRRDETSRGRPPSSYRHPQSEGGRSRSKSRAPESSGSRDLRVQQAVQVRPPSVVPPSMRASSSRAPSRAPTDRPASSRPRSVVPPSMRAASSRAPSRGPSGPRSGSPINSRGAPPVSYRPPVGATASTRSDRTYQPRSEMAPSVARTEGLSPSVRSPSSERTVRADDKPSSLRTWAESIPPCSARPPSSPVLPLIQLPSQHPPSRAPSYVPSRATSRTPSRGPSEGVHSVRTLSELMPPEHSNYERAVQRRADDWHMRQVAEAREREMAERAARELLAAECVTRQRQMCENAMAERAMYERVMAEQQAAASRRKAAESQMVAVQQVQMAMGGMALNVNQSVIINGGGSMPCSVSMDGGSVVSGGQGGCQRALRRSGGQGRSYSSSSSEGW